MMKAIILILSFCILIQEGYAGCGCYLKCTWGGCSWGCRCWKRSANEGRGQFKLLLPCKFEAWDINGNGGISFDEFEFTGHIRNANKDKKGRGLFKSLDRNGDGELSENELDAGNFEREEC